MNISYVGVTSSVLSIVFFLVEEYNSRFRVKTDIVKERELNQNQVQRTFI